MRKSILHIGLIKVLFFLIIYSSYAQKNSTDACKQLIRKAYQKIDVSGNKGASPTLIHYTTRITMWNTEETPNTETEIKLLTANRQIHFLTREASFYSDEKDVFLVVHRSADLIRSKAVLTSEEENFFIKQASLIKDSLLITSAASFCQEIKQADGSLLTKVELVPPARTRRIYKIEKVIFLLDKTTATIKKLQIQYSKESAIRQIDNTYHLVDNHSRIKLSTPVYYLFFDKRDKLLPRYKDFNYIDNTL